MYQSDLTHSNQSLANKLQALYALNRGARLEQAFRPQYLRLLEKFGNPHLQLPKTIHLAGTNGKGSTIAFLRAMLEAEGYRVHSYTSPHLIEFNERITLAGQPITNDHLETLIDQAVTHHDGSDISFFEITTAIAFKAFAQNSADILLLETGLGGRLDCTNVIESPLATILTPIGLDHQEFLGNTVSSIASEKAGIMKPGAPCIIAHQPDPKALTTLLDHAAKHNITTLSSPKNWSLTSDQPPSQDTLHFKFSNESYRLQMPSLQGSHQIQNAATSIAAIHAIASNLPVSLGAINAGLKSAHWPARMQNLTPHASLPEGTELWLDGGHNQDAAAAITTQMTHWQNQDPKPLHAIIGMMNHKDSRSFTATLKSAGATIHPTYIPSEQPADLPHWQDILKSLTQPNQRILICGSLYLAGNVLQTLGIKA